MQTRYSALGLAIALALFSGCASGAAPEQAPVATAEASSAAPAASEQPASQAAQGGSDIDALVSQMSAAMAGVKTYSFDIDMETVVMGNPAVMKTKGTIDQSDPANKKMKMDASIAGMDMKMLQVDGEMYLQMAVLGDKWMKVPEDQKSQYDEAANTGDVAANFEKSKGSIKALAVVGEETIDGVATKHYLVTYDPSALPNLTGGTGGLAGDSLEYHMWIDADSLIRKVSMESKVEADGEEMPMKMVGTMGDYNKPVTIKAPSKDEITDLPG